MSPRSVQWTCWPESRKTDSGTDFLRICDSMHPHLSSSRPLNIAGHISEEGLYEC